VGKFLSEVKVPWPSSFGCVDRERVEVPVVLGQKEKQEAQVLPPSRPRGPISLYHHASASEGRPGLICGWSSWWGNWFPGTGFTRRPPPESKTTSAAARSEWSRHSRATMDWKSAAQRLPTYALTMVRPTSTLPFIFIFIIYNLSC
jgi:hypothetical protein